MHFLTEEDAKRRCVSGELRLEANERLTPAALEMLHSQGCRIASANAGSGLGGAVVNCSAATPPPKISVLPKAPAATNSCSGSCSQAAPVIASLTAGGTNSVTPSGSGQGPLPQGTTYLDANTVVNKSHPRIMFRGKLDSLIAACVVVQTQFDIRKSLPELVTTGLADINTCLWYLLQTEITGAAMPGVKVCDMDANTLRTVSLNPKHYLNIDHIVPSGSLGPNVALLNWLRTLVREVEVVCTEVSPDRIDMLEGLNRLSTAVYVLMLLVVLAENGQAMPKVATS